MKTLMVILGIVALITFSACEKEETCVCVDTDGDVIRTNTYATTYNEALDLCNASAAELNDNDSIGETYFCTLE